MKKSPTAPKVLFTAMRGRNTRLSLLVMLTAIFCGCAGKRGEVKERYANGKVKKRIEYTDRNKYYEREYYENGNLEKETLFKDGVKDSIMTEYCENGSKGAETAFRNGVRNGVTHELFRNGQIAFEGVCVDDKFEGLSTWYYRNGKIQQRGYRHLGKDTGRWVYYDTLGALTGVLDHYPAGRNRYYNGAGVEITRDEFQKIPFLDQDRCQ